jgi:hypothetical protein
MATSSGKPVTEKGFESKLEKINVQLKNHGGAKNMIDLSALTTDELVFVKELVLVRLADYIKTAKERLEDYFYAEIESGKMKSVPVHCKQIEIPKKFGPETQWELTLGDRTFFGPVVVFTMKGWEEDDVTLVG